MNAIKAIVQNGRLETEEPIDLPDGTELTISLLDVAYDHGAQGATPEDIAAWIAWYDALEPLKMTVAEEADAEAWLKRCSAYAAARKAQEGEELFQ